MRACESTMTRFLQDNSSDPRQELIPKAPPIEGDLPSGEADVSADLSAPAFDGTISDILAQLFGDWWVAILGLGGLGAILSLLWSIYTFLAYLLCLIFLILYIYATIKREYYSGLLVQATRDAEDAWNQAYRNQGRSSRLDDVYAHAASNNPNDWKLAIIEADIVLDKTLQERGYIGDSLGERLRHITPSQLASIDDAWEAHRVRNKIAHEGADFVLTQRIAEETITKFRRVFTELGVE